MSGRILVTGAGGFIGAHTTLALLDAGRQVRATASSPSRADEVRAFFAGLRPDAPPLDVVPADLDDDLGWADALTGCDDVIHLASPIPVDQPKDADDLIRPARDGALRVLRAAREHDVRRVVMTSSLAAIAGSRTGRPVTDLDESDWTDLDAPKVTAYNRSKTIAERAARDDVAANGGPELVTVNPGLVLGPLLRPHVNASVEVVHRLLNGAVPAIPRVGFEVVDVRDVADLHVRALDHPDADGGRFVAAAGWRWFADIAATMRAGLGDRASEVPKRNAPDWLIKVLGRFDGGIATIVPDLGEQRNVSARTSRDVLGWTPRDPDEAVVACAESLIEHGLGPR